MPKRIEQVLPDLGAYQTQFGVYYFTPEQISSLTKIPCNFFLAWIAGQWQFSYDGSPDDHHYQEVDTKFGDHWQTVVNAVEEKAKEIDWFKRISYEEFQSTTKEVYPDQEFTFNGSPELYTARSRQVTIAYWRSLMAWDIETDDSIGKGRTLLQAITHLKSIDYSTLDD
ncbi:hypothetical protein [Synechococcus elongatus]|uniref:hypothetical protein n=1 Tax=Synechococcus elongatus TaxID=32046 RepID=UPI000F7EE805|nr:hypothetical protein [Synechococcus elongatus]